MAAFEYLALTPEGRRCKGVLEADSARQARQLLRDRQLAPVRLAAATDDASRAAAWWPRGGGLSTSGLALLTRQLATLIQAAVPVDQALRAVAAQSGKPRIRTLLLSLRGDVAEGQTLANAMSRHPRAFPALYRNMVAAGERSHLGVVLEQLADYTEQLQQTRQRLQLALLYPAILSAAALLIIGFLMGYVVPNVIDAFVDSGQALPWATRALLAISHVTVTAGPWLLVLAIAGVVVTRRRLVDVQRRARFHRTLLRVPVLGRLLRDVDTTRFTTTLSILVRSGIPLVDALHSAAQVVDNLAVRAELLTVEDAVRKGGSLSRALETHASVPPMLLHLVAAGEQSGALDRMLERASRNQESTLTARVSLLAGLFEPLVLVLMGAAVLFIVLAVLLPIMSLNQLVG